MEIFRGIILLQLLIPIIGFEDFGDFEESDICESFDAVEIQCDCFDTDMSCVVEENYDKHYWSNFTYKKSISRFELEFTHVAEGEVDLFPYYVFSQLPNLGEVDIKEGSFPVLKKYIFHNISSLETIRVHKSGIRKLEKFSFANLENLQYLDLMENKIEKIGIDVFKNLPNLDALSLDFNAIAEIESFAFQDLKALTDLSLGHNKLKVLNPHTFSGLKKLTNLNLKNNQIIQLNDGIFADLNALSLLSLDNNEIAKISPKAFEGLEAVTTLTVNHNKVSTLNEVKFGHLKQVVSIELTANKFKTFEESWFKSLDLNRTGGPSIVFVDNPLDCSCDLQWLLTIKENFMFSNDVDDAECTISKRLPYPGKTVGQKYRLKDARGAETSSEYFDLCDKSVAGSKTGEEELNSTPSVDEGSSVDGERKTNKHYVDSTEDKNKNTNAAVKNQRASSLLSFVFALGLMHFRWF